MICTYYTFYKSEMKKENFRETGTELKFGEILLLNHSKMNK